MVSATHLMVSATYPMLPQLPLALYVPPLPQVGLLCSLVGAKDAAQGALQEALVGATALEGLLCECKHALSCGPYSMHRNFNEGTGGCSAESARWDSRA